MKKTLIFVLICLFIFSLSAVSFSAPPCQDKDNQSKAKCTQEMSVKCSLKAGENCKIDSTCIKKCPKKKCCFLSNKCENYSKCEKPKKCCKFNKTDEKVKTAK